MTKILLKLFVKDHEDTSNIFVREKYGFLSGVVGIIVNIVLFFAKFFIGTITNSIAIVADAINNLSDSGSCIVTLVGFKMSNRKPDKEHPFGHGRIEYIAALIVGFIVATMGVEIIKSSIDKILNPQTVKFSVPAVIVLILSILAKVWLAIFNNYLGKKIDSPALRAVSKDSLSDTISTFATLVCLILSRFTDLPLDGYAGILVAGFILFSAFSIIKETVSVILGTPPQREVVDSLIEFVLSHDHITGIHDLVIHSYGAAKTFATIHAEIRADEDIIKIHDTIDVIEKEVYEKFAIQLVIHIDPLAVDDERVQQLREITSAIISDIDEGLHFHDFRVVEGPTHTNLIFDLVIPYSYKLSHEQIKQILDEKIKDVDETYFIVATIENSYL